jgi:hypothetical protein
MIVFVSKLVDESNVQQLKIDLAPFSEEVKPPEVVPIVEKDGKDYSNIPMAIQNEVEHEIKPKIEEDEELDLETFKFFEDFLKTHQNHRVKDKIERMFILLRVDNDISELTNKIKNEILQNLKSEYLTELEKIRGIAI